VTAVGRPEWAIIGTGAPAQLGRQLRNIRAAAGVTLDELAVLTGLSKATLSKAQGGRDVPTWMVVTRFVDACGGSLRNLRSLYERARAAQDGGPAAVAVPVRVRPVQTPSVRVLAERWRELDVTDVIGPAPIPHRKATVARFVDDLRMLKAWAGVSFDHVSRVTGIPTSTLNDALQPGRVTAPRQEIVLAFLIACGVEDRDIIRPWLNALSDIEMRTWSRKKRRPTHLALVRAA
jgi:transcriptional regulator with XRE-family HTH domain